MIEVSVTNGRCSGKIAGATNELFADVMTVINTVYLEMKEEYAEGAEEFKDAILSNIIYAFYDEEELGEKVDKILRDILLKAVFEDADKCIKS